MRQVWVVLACAALPSAARALEAPVSAVTVFSDRARVTRAASVVLDGRQRLELPVLGDRVDGSSIRLDAEGAEVQTVDLKWVAGDEAFPQDEARQVLAALEKLDAELAQAARDRSVHLNYDILSVIEPAIPGVDAPRAAPRLDAAGWAGVTAFARGWSERAHGQRRALEERIRELSRQRADLGQRAQQLGADRRRGGWKVNATVTGKGKAALLLSYLVMGARWYPSYDIQLDAAASKVQVAFAGLVSQETGEDWERAAVTLSTAVPATTAAYPKVYTWKIGERERFIPKPSPYVEPVPPPPPAILRPSEVDGVQRLRQALLVRAASPPDTDTGDAGLVHARRNLAKAKKTGVVEPQGDRDHDAIFDDAPAAPPPPSPPPAAAPAPSRAYESASEEVQVLASGPTRSLGRRMSKSEMPAVSIGIAPPPGYVPPPIRPDLPAALAGGYDLTYKAAAPETIRSGKGARRVALFGRSFPVSVERRVFPDLQPESAFLVAELKNPTGQPLPGGQAKLFVGADPAGVAQLKTVAPGETFTLPLGLDRGIKPVRNVKVVTSESGVISKDETSEYTVTIEVANPGRAPMRLRVVDQIPVTDDKDLEIKLVRTNPGVSARDQNTGKLEWQLSVPAAGKALVSFVYTLKRPKGYLLHQ
jgi:hypothetical protein